MFMFAVMLLWLVVGSTTNGFSLLNERIYVSEGGSFFQYVVDSGNKLSNCSAEFLQGRQAINCELDINKVSSPQCEPTFQDRNNLTHRVTSLGNGLCGFRLDNATKTDPESWTMKASNSSVNYTATFKVLFYAAVPTHSTHTVTIGASTTITCGSSYQNQDYCHLYNPQEELVSNGIRCDLYIQIVSLEDIGRWYCKVGAVQYFEAKVFTVDVVDKGIETTDGWVEEHDDHLSIGCRIKNMSPHKIFKPPYCLMVSPHGEELVIRPGLAIGPYTTFNTNLTAHICGIEIQKPVMVSDMGIWRCEIGDHGHVLRVGNNADYVQNITSVSVELGNPFTVQCMVPYSSTKCFVLSPNGTHYYPDKPTRSEIGECKIQLLAKQEHHGQWLCHFFKKDDAVSHQVKFDVIISDGITCSRQVSTIRGNEVQLSCSTGRTPLQYCWFISPSKEIYQLEPGTNTTRFAYIGRGLNHGDCGIKIHKVWQSDNGNWTCITKLGYGYKLIETSNVLTLNVSFIGSTTSSVLGTIIGIIIVACLVWGLMTCRNKRRRLFTTSSQTELNGSSSVDNSEAHVAFSQEQHPKYS